MPHYSPPLPFRRGRAGCPCVLASPRGRPARGSRTCALAGPRPGSRWPAGARPARGSRTSAARLRMGGEEESARTGDSNPGCNYPVRGYSPSRHFLWGGDMPHYSPPLPFRRGRAGCPCVLASPRGRPARGSRTCALAGVPRPVPRAGAAYARDGPWARPGAWRGGCGLAGCVACPGPRPRSRPRMCALAGGRAPGAGVADVRGTVEDGRGGGICPNGGFQSRL